MTTQPFNFDSIFSTTAPPARGLGMAKRGKYDFAVAYPDPNSIPTEGLLEGLREALAAEGGDLSLYAHPQGYTPLREFVANKLSRDRHIQVSADDIILGSGSSGPIQMVLEVLLEPGDVAFTEEFVYVGTLNQMRRFQADIRGIPCDGEGMLPDALEAAIQQAQREGKRPKVIYTIPSFQNPLGWTMTLERRKAMVALAQKYGVPILEDDCYVDLSFEGENVTSIHSLDDSGLVMYVASFSKIIAPGMRLGYLTAPRQLLEKAISVKSGGSVNTFASFAIHRFSTGQLHNHIEVINDVQRARRDAMVNALDEHFSGRGVRWSRPKGGLFVWLQMQPGVDLAAIRDQVLETVDVGYHPGHIFSPDLERGKNCARLCFGYNTPSDIAEGIGRMAEAFGKAGVL